METYNQPPTASADDLIRAPSASADLIRAPSAADDLIRAPPASADDLIRAPPASADDLIRDPSASADDLIRAPSASAADLIRAPSASAADLIQAPSASADRPRFASTDPHQIRRIGFDGEGDKNVAVREITCGCGKTRTVRVIYGSYFVFECKACKGEYHLDDVPECETIIASIRRFPDYQAYVAAIFSDSRNKRARLNEAVENMS